MSVRILVGHALDRLRELPDESVHCVVTSPPYYGLRDYKIEPQVWDTGKAWCEYGTPGGHEWATECVAPQSGGTGAASAKQVTNAGTQGEVQRPIERAFCLRCEAWRGSLGLEPTLNLYLDHMVEVFREVRRVMRKDATCWLNIGDSYATSSGAGAAKPRDRDLPNPVGGWSARNAPTVIKTAGGTIKPKDLMMIPARLAIRLQDDGWWVRSDIAWCKRAPMPESCTDRPTSAWEHVFLLTRSAKYFYDAEAVKEEGSGRDPGNVGHAYEHMGGTKAGLANIGPSTSRNQRNFWLLGPEPFPLAHFATFPTEIPRRAILAGTSERGVCPKCSAPWERMVDKPIPPKSVYTDRHAPTDGLIFSGRRVDGVMMGSGQKLQDWVNEHPAQTLGWRPTCGCDAGDPVPSTVLDPFLGSGTTALVADRLGRDCVGIELNPEYAAMARRRIEDDAGLFAEVAD